MIVVLTLSKIEPAVYRADVTDGGVSVTEPSFHSSLTEALRAVATSVPPDFARFVEPRYHGCCSGTISCEALASTAEQVAERLVGLVAEVQRSEEC